MKIGKTVISPDKPPYIIAELSGNHNGDIDNVFALIDAADNAGADAIKLQTYTPDTITLKSDHDDFIIKEGPWKGRTLHELYTEAHTPFEWHERIFDYARNVRNIEIFSSVFDETAIELLERLGCPCYKIASFELTDLPLIERAAATGKPMIISTGMGTPSEIIAAASTYKRIAANPDNLALLHCVSAYPTPASQANLPALGQLSDLMGGKHVVGLSDHTLGVGCAAGAVAFGACIIEKHVTLSRASGGCDSGFSLEPDEFERMVNACHDAWEATRPSRSPAQQDNRQFRRSIYVTQPIAAGERLSTANVRVIRPAFGLPPKFYPFVLGERAIVDLQAGRPLSLDQITVSDELLDYTREQQPDA